MCPVWPWLGIIGWFTGWPLHGVPPIAQLPGTAACITEDGTSGACGDGVALDGAGRVAVSPDGRSVYVTSVSSNAIAVFDRNPATGRCRRRAS